MVKVGIIGGSGFYDVENPGEHEELNIETPWGPASDSILKVSRGDVDIYFLSLHGRGHLVGPSEINYRANIYALKFLGVDWIISVSAVGSMKEEIPPGKIVIPDLRLSGVIGSAGRFRQGIDFSGQQEMIKKAFSFKKAKNIAISINSPGGSPVQSHLIHDYIRQLAKKNNKKVLVFAEDVAASGGYLIACAGDEIYANSSSIVGSIGVISSSFCLLYTSDAADE